MTPGFEPLALTVRALNVRELTAGFLYIASQLLYTNSKVAQMAIGTIGLPYDYIS